MRFKITTPGVITGNYHVVISCSVNFELDIATRNLPVPTPSIVTLNCIFLIYNVPVTTPGAVVLNFILLTANLLTVTPGVVV